MAPQSFVNVVTNDKKTTLSLTGTAQHHTNAIRSPSGTSRARPHADDRSREDAVAPSTKAVRLATAFGVSVVRLKTILMGIALLGIVAGGSGNAGEVSGASSQGSADWLGIAAGPAATAETVLAADMASLFAAGAPLRVLPMLGDAGEGNVELLLDESHVDIAFVSTDALAAAEAARKDLADHLELVVRLYPQEVHVLARADIRTISDLAGKKVSFGPVGSGSSITGSSLFKALGIDVDPQSLDPSLAIERLKQGSISAPVIVSGKPSPLIAGIPADLGLHLLPIDFGEALQAAYLPTRLGAEDYPNLIDGTGEVPTVATGMLLLAAKSKNDPSSQIRIARFVDTLFPRFAELQASDRHPKWREVNLAASLPGLSRTPEARPWLADRPIMTARPIAETSGSVTAAAAPRADGKGFRQFIQWQRDQAKQGLNP
jgi:TRAP transporter TAXI family solute receptor